MCLDDVTAGPCAAIAVARTWAWLEWGPATRAAPAATASLRVVVIVLKGRWGRRAVSPPLVQISPEASGDRHQAATVTNCYRSAETTSLRLDLRPGIAERDGAIEHERARATSRSSPSRSIPFARTDSATRPDRCATLGSILASRTTTSDSGFTTSMNPSSSTSSGSGTVNSLSYSRSSQVNACGADTQWIVPCTLRPSGASPPGRRIVRAAQLDDVSRSVLDHVRARDEVAVAKPNLPPGREAEELLRRILHEIVALDVELARERDLPRARSSARRADSTTRRAHSTCPSG